MKRQNQFGALLVLLVALALGGAPADRTAAAAAPELRVLEVTSSVVAVDLSRVEPAVMAEHALHQPSVAALRKMSKNRFRTSVGQEIRLTARVAPRRLAARLEWRVFAKKRQIGLLRGADVQLAFARPGVYTV